MKITELLGVIVGLLTAITLAIGLIGVMVRYILIPYLESHLIEPVRETHKAVTVNGGTSTPPTLLDKVSSLGDRLDDLDEKLDRHLESHANRDLSS